MKAKLIKTERQYVLSANDADLNKFESAIDTDSYGWVIADEYGGYILKLSKQNCDEIFGVVDVEKLAKQEFDRPYIVYMGTDLTPAYQDGFKIGFNKAMELYQPTEIEVEVVMQCIDPNCDSLNRKGCCIPGDKPRIDAEGCLILKKI